MYIQDSYQTKTLIMFLAGFIALALELNRDSGLGDSVKLLTY